MGGPGATGATGAAGRDGVNGFDGQQGPTGRDGTQGFQGYQGIGFQGRDGIDGTQGNQGDQGDRGFQGGLGSQGYQGDIGFQGYQGIDGTQGPGNQDIYVNPSATPTTIGGIASGSTFGSGRTMQQMWDLLLYPYQSPAFTTFSISGQATTVEVGTSITGTQTFLWSTSNSSNVSANTIIIRDVTASTTLVSGSANDGTEPINIGTVQKTSQTSNQWSIQGTNTNSVNFSSTFTVNWNWKLFYGTSTNTVLTATQIQALANNLLTTTAARTYALASGGYKFWAWPNSFASPSVFKDTSTNLGVAMADSSDDASFSNVANGFNYALVSVTNSLSQTTSYRVYRTKNVLGGSISVQVS
jgi:hypothetical protein